jgi:putative Holliday junction resolvase
MENFFMKTKKTSFLGLDLGEKTLGIAISEFGIIAQNLKTIYFDPHNYFQLIKPLKEIVEKFNIKTIILGYPKHMNNDLGIKAEISYNFQKQINFSLPYIKVILWDERLSTVQADLILIKIKNKKKKRKLKNEISAMIILQDFLNYINYNNKNNKL